MATRRMRRILVVSLVVAVAVVVILLLPPVQTVLVRSMVGGVDGLDFDVDRVWAGPWGAEMEGLRVRTSVLELQVDRVDADLAFWSSLRHLALDVEQASASGVDLRLELSPSDGVEVSEPLEFHGLAPLARLPKRVIIRQARSGGTMTVNLANGLSIEGPWKLEASDVGPNRRLNATADVTLETKQEGEAVLAAVIGAVVEADADGEGVLRTIGADADIRSLEEDPRGVDAKFALVLDDAGESYSATVDGSEGHRLLDAEARYVLGAEILNASWEATATEGLVAAFGVGDSAPDLWGRSTGSVVVDLNARQMDIETAARFETREWAKLDPRLADVTELVVDLDVAMSVGEGRIDASRFRMAVIPEAGHEMLWLEALAPVKVDLERLAVVPQVWGDPAIRINFDRFPLRWTRGFDSAVVVEDGAISAALDVVPVDTGHLVLKTHEPIRLRGLQLRPGDAGVRPPLLDVTIVPRMKIDNGVLEAEITSFQMTADTGLRVSFTGGASTSREQWPVIDLNGDITARLPRLQAVVDSLDAVRGQARFALDLQAMTLILDTAALGATDAVGRPLVKVALDNETPLSIAMPSLVVDWEGSSTQELNILFDGLPIVWVSPFIPELEFEGGALYGELEAVAGGGAGVRLDPVEPFEVRGLKPVYRGTAFGDGASLSLKPYLGLDNSSVRVLLEEIAARTPQGGRLDGRVVLEAVRDGRKRITYDVTFEGEVPAIANRIGRIGALSWSQRGHIDVPRRRVEVKELELGLTDQAGTRFLELDNLRPFVLTADPFGVWVGGGSPEILVATITPLELQQLFPRVFGFELEGVLPQGQFVGRTEDGGLLLVAEDELVFKDVSVRWEEAALLDRVTVGLTYEVLYSADGLQARTIDFSTLGPRGTPIADATLRAVMPLTDRTTIESLHFETVANLESLTRQPIFTGLPAFLGGTVGGSVDLLYGDVSTIQGTAALRDARVENYGTLPDLDASLDVVSIEGQSLEVRAPFRMSSDNGSSDLSFEGTVQRDGDGYRFRSSLKGNSVVAADVTRLIHLVAPPDPDFRGSDLREPAASAFRERWSKNAIDQLREQRDTEPFWGADVMGEASLDLGTIQLARAALTDVRGRLEVDPNAIEAIAIEASLLGARFTAEGAIHFDGADDLPYELRLDSSFEGLDLGRLFRAVNPDEPPTLEGIFEVHSTASGQGRNPADLGLGTLGEMRLSGRNGIFRGMAGQYKWARRGTKVVGFLTFSKQLKAISRLLGELEALEFDTFDAVLARETPRRFAISELTVVSPLARIEGSGGVEVEPGVPLVESPLDASFDMATNGDMTILFDAMALLEEGTDEHGYRPLTRPVTVGGTVTEPDTSDFYEMLDAAATDSKGVIGVGMRKVNKKLQKAQAAQSP